MENKNIVKIQTTSDENDIVHWNVRKVFGTVRK